MFRVASLVQQIITELSGVVTEENNVNSSTNIPSTLMKQDGQKSL
jgi:hypothetical protein